MVLSVKRFMPRATMRRISSSGSQARIALPNEVACGASILPTLPVSTRTAWRASRTASVTTESPCKAARCTVSPVARLTASR